MPITLDEITILWSLVRNDDAFKKQHPSVYFSGTQIKQAFKEYCSQLLGVKKEDKAVKYALFSRLNRLKQEENLTAKEKEVITTIIADMEKKTGDGILKELIEKEAKELDIKENQEKINTFVNMLESNAELLIEHAPEKQQLPNVENLKTGLALNELTSVKDNKKQIEMIDPDDQNFQGNLYFLQYLYSMEKEDGEKAIECFRKAAELGHPSAQAILGKYYMMGEIVAQDEKQAINWLNMSAAQGNREAQFYLAKCYQMGVGVSQDLALAASLLQELAETAPENLFSAQIQNELGACFEEGLGVTKDAKKAFTWYMKAASQGDYFAQFNLAKCYKMGIGVDQDLKLAAQILKIPAEQHTPIAENEWGICYQEGLVVAKDEKEAFKWYQYAAEHGVAEGQCNLGSCYFNGSGVARDYIKAVEWYEKAAAQGDAYAEYYLGDCYEKGLGVPSDEKKAYLWYEKAAKQNHSEAANKCRCQLEAMPEMHPGVSSLRNYISSSILFGRILRKNESKSEVQSSNNTLVSRKLNN